MHIFFSLLTTWNISQILLVNSLQYSWYETVKVPAWCCPPVSVTCTHSVHCRISNRCGSHRTTIYHVCLISLRLLHHFKLALGPRRWVQSAAVRTGAGQAKMLLCLRDASQRSTRNAVTSVVRPNADVCWVLLERFSMAFHHVVSWERWRSLALLGSHSTLLYLTKWQRGHGWQRAKGSPQEGLGIRTVTWIFQDLWC